MSPSSPKYSTADGYSSPYLYDLETYSRYKCGGCHPVHIDDEMHDGRYRVLHLLGRGTFADVWLAENQHYGSASLSTHLNPAPPERYVAIKVPMAEVSSTTQETQIRGQHNPSIQTHGWVPWEISQFLRCKDGMDINRKYVASLLDVFEIQGVNGTHHCMVMELLGPTPLDLALVLPDGILPPEISRRAVAQIAKGLAFLHSHGVVHGDVHAGNIAFTLPEISSLSADELCGRLGGRPKTAQLSAGPHLPRYLVAPLHTSYLWELCVSNGRIPSARIIDFGESFLLPFPGQKDKLPATPLQCRPPELLLNLTSEIASGIDIWAFACTSFFLLRSWEPFSVPMGQWYKLMYDIMFSRGPGEKGLVWTTYCERFGNDSKFTRDGQVVDHEYFKMNFCSWEEKLDAVCAGFSEEDSAALRAIFDHALRIDPSRRATANELVGMIPDQWDVFVAIEDVTWDMEGSGGP